MVDHTLSESEERWRSVLEGSFDYILSLDLEGRILYLNRSSALIDTSKAIGRRLVDLVPPESASLIRESLDRARNMGVAVEYESSRPTPEGPVEHFEARVVPTVRDGQVEGFTIIARDVTVRHNAELELSFYGEITRSAPIGLYVWRLEDRDDLTSFRMVASNRAAETITGVPMQELLGRRMGEAFPRLLETRLPAAYRTVVLDGVERDLGEIQYGDDRVAKSWFSVKAFPLPGDCVGVAFENITLRVNAEDALRRSEERYRALVTNIPHVIWTSDIEGRSTYISPNIEGIYGFSAEEVIAGGESLWFDRIHPEDIDRVREAYRSLFTGRGFDVEYRIQHKDGRWIWLLDQALTTYERAGRWFADGVFSEVTDRKRAEARLAAEHAVTRVLSESKSVAEAAQGVLRAIGESVGCTVAALWSVSGTPATLVCNEIWGQPGTGAGAFEAICRATRFRRGVGLPGSVWEKLSPQWISDLTEARNFPRKEIAMHAGLRSGFGFPIQAEGELFGVMEFFMTQRASPDPALLNMMAAIGSEIGQFIRRNRAEEALRANEAEMRAVLDAALDAVVGMDAEGKVVSWNPRAETIFGWTRAEAVGRNLGELIVPRDRRGRHREGLERFLRTGEATMLGRRAEMIAQRRDGSEFSVELSLTARQSGESWLFNAFIADITERKAAEQERARLLESEHRARTEAERALDRLRVIQSITEAALAHLSLDDLLGTLLARLRAALRSDSATVLLLDETTGSLVVRASDGLDVQRDGGPMRIPLNQGVAGKVAASGHPTIIDDIDSVEVLSPYFRAHVRSLVAVPLLVEGSVIGVLHAGSSVVRRFVADDMRLLEMVADRVAPAMDRARLFDEVREGRTRLSALSNRLVELQETERREIARELHDEIGQLLTGLKLLLESDERRARASLPPPSSARDDGAKATRAAKSASGARASQSAKRAKPVRGAQAKGASPAKSASVRRATRATTSASAARAGSKSRAAAAPEELAREQMKALVNDLMGRVRDLSMDLRPAMLDDLGLVPALLWLFERYQTQTGIRVDFHHAGVERRFRPAIETAAFRITQEALTNAARHAKTDEVRVHVRVDDGHLRLRIDDGGAGFSPEPPGSAVRSSGLTGMKERARLLGGSLTVESAPGAGTRILTEIPIAETGR